MVVKWYEVKWKHEWVINWPGHDPRVQGPGSREWGMPAVYHSTFSTISAGRANNFLWQSIIWSVNPVTGFLFFFSLHSAIHMLYFSRVLVFPVSQKLTSICGCWAFSHHSESIHFQIRKSSGIPSSTCSGLPFLILPVVMLSKGNGTAHAPSILLPSLLNQAVGYLLNSHLEDEWAFGIYFKIFKNHFTLFFFTREMH